MALIASWNVNSINARIQHFEKFAKEVSPDVILLQETKCVENAFPKDVIEDLGYNVSIYGQKSYNGVAILSKSSIDDISRGLEPDNDSEDARYIEAFTEVDKIPFRIASVYVPNGQEVGSPKFAYKLRFFKMLKERLKQFNQDDEVICMGGDFNVAPDPEDVYNPKYLEGKIGFNIEERINFRKILNEGMFDSFRLHHPEKQAFSWWDYRSGSYQQDKGMRIDHILLSAKGCDLITKCDIYRDARSWEKPSDHAPVLCELKKDIK